MRFERKDDELVARFTKDEALALGRILSQAGSFMPGKTDTEHRCSGFVFVELAGAIEAFTDEAVMGTAEVLQVLDGDRDAVESEGDFAKAWRAAWDGGAGEAS